MLGQRRTWLGAAVLVAAVWMFGCSSSTSPLDGGTPPADNGAPADSTPAGAGTSGLAARTLSRLLGGLVVRLTNVDLGIGETLSNGRWRLVIPDGAIDGEATVALALPRTTDANCQLEILPLSKNHFDVPVTLIADCHGVSDAQLANYKIYWYNPAMLKWVELAESKVDLPTKTVSVPLTHFSKYAVGPAGGKAGW